MEPQIDKILQDGILAHKEGKIKDAERLYRIILLLQPSHPHAYHNLGILYVSLNKTNKSIPLFKAAVGANPTIEQFWISYLSTLIKLGSRDKAEEVLEQAKRNGLGGEKFKVFEVELTTGVEPTAEAGPSKRKLINLLDHYQHGRFSDAEKLASSFTNLFPMHPFAWKVLSVIFSQSKRIPEAENASQIAIVLSPQDAEAHRNFANLLKKIGRLEEAEANYNKAIVLKSGYAEAFYSLAVTLKDLGKLNESIKALRKAINYNPDFLEARTFLNEVLNSAVPAWHLAMMNDKNRNNAYFDAIKLAVAPGDFVLEIGTGSGLLSLMAASCGADRVVTCEISKTISCNAEEIIKENGYAEKITVLNKKSTELMVGEDLPQKADLIISEVLSAEFVGEGVRETTSDANNRLLKNNGKIIPQSGKIKIALIGSSPELFDKTTVNEVNGFDLSKFNSISQRKFSLKLENRPAFMSFPMEVFNFNLRSVNKVEKEETVIELEANKDGVCIGLIQWLWINLYNDIEYENFPGEIHSHWPTPIYLFDEPIHLKKREVVEIKGLLGRDTVWFYKQDNV